MKLGQQQGTNRKYFGNSKPSASACTMCIQLVLRLTYEPKCILIVLQMNDEATNSIRNEPVYCNYSRICHISTLTNCKKMLWHFLLWHCTDKFLVHPLCIMHNEIKSEQCEKCVCGWCGTRLYLSACQQDKMEYTDAVNIYDFDAIRITQPLSRFTFIDFLLQNPRIKRVKYSKMCIRCYSSEILCAFLCLVDAVQKPKHKSQKSLLLQ